MIEWLAWFSFSKLSSRFVRLSVPFSTLYDLTGARKAGFVALLLPKRDWEKGMEKEENMVTGDERVQGLLGPGETRLQWSSCSCCIESSR